MVVSDLWAKIDPVVTASDASETGGGARYASRLSRMGAKELEELMESENPVEPEVADDFRVSVPWKWPRSSPGSRWR